MVLNITSIETSSDGFWQGDNPLHYAFPLLIIQTTLVIIISRFLALFLKPLRQPKVVAEIIGGIVLGPSALGQNKEFTQWIFPEWSTPILESVASIGLLFFLFLVGLELDLSSIRKSGKRAFGIAAAGISLPFLLGIGITFLLRKAVAGVDKVAYIQCLMFIGVSLSITAFPVLARILAELKLLTTQVGETAMAAAAFNDIAAWILLALAVALAGGPHKSPLVSIWVLISGVTFVAFMLIIVRPAMIWVARQSSQATEASHFDIMGELYICITLTGVMLSGFMTDLIGIHAIFGAFVFGLTIPKGGEFATRLIKRIEDFVSGLLLPLYFASSGLKTNVAKIQGLGAWGLLFVVISTACAGKILGTFAVAMMCTIPLRESLALGVLMNTKGLVELIVLNIGKEKKVLNDEMFAILVVMAIFTTFMTTPAVMAIYKPARHISSCIHHRSLQELPCLETSKYELRILACVYGLKSSPSLIKLIKSIRSTRNHFPMKLYIMHLVELTDRSSSIVMVRRARKNGVPFISRFRHGESHDQVAPELEAYRQIGAVKVRPTTAISGLSTMHEDICHVAENKRATMIILPFLKVRREENIQEMENVGHEWRLVNKLVLMNTPCTVAVLVDRGFGALHKNSGTNTAKGVCIVFLGGPDNREALEIGRRMAEHPDTKITVIRLVEKTHTVSSSNPDENSYSLSITPKIDKEEKDLDDNALAEFRRRWDRVEYLEKTVSRITEAILAIGRSIEYELIIVGKGRFPQGLVAELADQEAENSELGLVGDLLASSSQGITSSVLVVQKHDLGHAGKALETNQVHFNNDSVTPDAYSV